MDLHRIRLIAIKEAQDHLTSFRFIGLLFLLLTICGIFFLKETGTYLEGIRSCSSGTSSIYNLPYTVNIFGGIMSAIGGRSIFGPIIAVALGFDLITKERESGSIKAILSVPVYRDEVINGKALGGIIVLAITTTIVFVLAFAVLLVHSIVPGVTELSYIFMFWLFTVLFLSGVFIMSLMISTFSKTSGMSLVFSLLALLFFMSVVYTAGNYTAEIIMGSDPSTEYQYIDSLDNNELYQMSVDYNKNKDELMQFVEYISIRMDYWELSKVLTWPQHSRDYSGSLEFDRTLPPVGETLASMWGYVLFLIAYPAVFFGIAYVRFMRTDLR
ncbi:ABC-type transport system involved in multi-copper enzyme maturation permease component-like protein [Methanolacinia petrolearia DSM 11571]|uniref:ABC-type transport system involved in multi-copper enzyme maturation permease component-like protein n=1 Tax=Methanolacinia petrolearia (strain DSM 11571 / OCM 486 / SEBR 4847) TaxID=679926 RepID=E1RGQ5_METP4|nr:ABC transporter permease subunit [Methanolacinia petrolearia]ADN36350.1 ABC-type transport system involved in multi-copper enzyme maturation permease component-like protein [Methanolacinia petrolearia DSM 11571]